MNRKSLIFTSSKKIDFELLNAIADEFMETDRQELGSDMQRVLSGENFTDVLDRGAFYYEKEKLVFFDYMSYKKHKGYRGSVYICYGDYFFKNTLRIFNVSNHYNVFCGLYSYTTKGYFLPFRKTFIDILSKKMYHKKHSIYYLSNGNRPVVLMLCEYFKDQYRRKNG